MDLPEGLTHQVGPLPLAGWVGILGGAYVISHYLRNRTAASALTGVVDPGTGNHDGADTSTTPGADHPTTNAAWLQKAETELIGRGYDPATVDDALRRYTGGVDVLNLTEQAIVNAALVFAGPLPIPLPPAQHGPIPIPHPRIPKPPGPPRFPPPTGPPTPIVLPHNLPGVHVPANAKIVAPGVVAGVTDAGPFTYGGTPQQAAAIVGEVPPPNPPGQAAFDAQVADVLRARTEW